MHYPMLGVMTAVDTLLATTFGAGHLRAYADWTQVSLVAVTALTVPVMVGRRGMSEDKMCVSTALPSEPTERVRSDVAF